MLQFTQMSIESLPKQKTLEEPLELTSETGSLVLRELTEGDDEAYHALVQKNSSHLAQGGLKLAEMYRQPEDVAHARDTADLVDGMHRFGVWKKGNLVGGVDISPAAGENTSEISYFVDFYKTTEGIGRTAVKTALKYLDGIGHDTVAEVKPGHTSSSKLLMGQGFKLAGSTSGYAQYKRVNQSK